VPKYVDIMSLRFGMLLVLSRVENVHGGKRAAWLCRCDCGRECVVSGSSLRMALKSDCGCLTHGKMSAVHLKHGMSTHGRRPPEYMIWVNMNRRCGDPTNDHYAGYGGRGITVCDQWRTDFAVFYADMGPRPSPKYSIDRIDNGAGYSAANCRWATQREQQRNRRSNRPIEHEGRTQLISDWASEAGMGTGTLSARLRSGWPMARALATPVMRRVAS
jgi:hypothetical protein